MDFAGYQNQNEITEKNGNPFTIAKAYSQQNQTTLIKLLLKQSDGVNIDNWKLLNKWLNLQNCSHRSNISPKDIAFIIKETVKRFADYKNIDADAQKILVETVHCIINSPVFQQYLRHHPEISCKIISKCLVNLEDLNDIVPLLESSIVLFKYTTADKELCSHFLKTLFVPLLKTTLKFDDSFKIFMKVSQIAQKCLVIKSQQLSDSEDTEMRNEFIEVFEYITLLYKELDLSRRAYKILFQCVCNLYSSKFKEIYNFLIFLVDHLNFDVSGTFRLKNSQKLNSSLVPLSFSISVLADVFSILTKTQCSLDCAINNINFSDFLKTVILSVINVALVPNSEVYSILQNVIILNPLITEQIIAELLIYLMVEQNFFAETTQDYEKLMVSILQVFSKLHRIEKFVSITIQSLKTGLDGKHKSEKTRYDFQGTNDLLKKNVKLLGVDEILSDTVLKAFCQHVISLASWQIINICKTFNYHFTATLELEIEDENHQHFIELLSALFCCFLRSVRIAEHTVTLAVQEKFCKAMEELKVTLSKFGAALLNREHNQVLMRAYLNICYTWGDVCLMLAYYSSDKPNIVAKIEDSDYSLCNLIYLHDYLSREQWCMIAQRITNFGETPCKQIMHKLYIQKIKAMHVFKATCYNEMKRAFINNFPQEAEEHWTILLEEQMFLNQILPEMDQKSILSAADAVLTDFIANNNSLQQNLFNCEKLMKAVLYTVLHKIGKSVKSKRKSGEFNKNLCSKRLFAKVDLEMLFGTEEAKTIYSSFNEILQENLSNINCTVDTEKLNVYLDILKKLPVLYMSRNVQDIVQLYLITVLRDCKHILKNEEVKANLEHVVTGLLHHNPSLLPKITSFDILFSEIIPLFTKWQNNLMLILQWTVKNFEIFQKLQGGIEYILTLDTDEFLEWAVIFLKVISKTKRENLCQNSKILLTQYRIQICSKIQSILSYVDLGKSLEAYALTLKFFLSPQNLESFNEIERMLKSYLDYTITTLKNGAFVNGSLQLLVTVMRNKSRLKGLKESLPLDIWQASKDILSKDENNDDKKERLQLYMLVFEHVTNEDFILVTQELLQITTDALHNDEAEKYIYYLQIWNSVLGCCFNPIKTSTWQNALLALLKEQYVQRAHSAIVMRETGSFHQRLVQANQVPLTPSMIDIIVSALSMLLNTVRNDFCAVFTLCMSVMESLLKYRNMAIMDRLPMYLQQYRHLLQQLCIHGNSDLNLETEDVLLLADCAHLVEKLTNILVQNKKHLIRVAPYLIADFLFLFERFTLFPNIKVHFNNCLYSLISLCDQHSISYLMRVLSTASTEMFKVLFENYKKHYRFTGKI